MTEINTHHRIAIDKFSDACKEQLGIRPLEDDKLILEAACSFGTYIKTFKALDSTVAWHRKFIDTMVKVKVSTLSKRINKNYGTHKKYIDRMQRRHRPCSEAHKGNCVGTK